MRKLVLVFLAILLVFAVSAPAFALGVDTWDYSNEPVSPGPGWAVDDDSDDDGDDDDHHSSDNDKDNNNDGDVTPPSTEIVVASVSTDVNRLLQLTNSTDALLAVSATVPASLKNKKNPFSFQADALKTATGEAPNPIPFILYKIVGDQFVELKYDVDYTVNWKTGEITIKDVTDDCEFLFATI